MQIAEHFRAVDTIDASQVRRILKDNLLDKYNLLDVREPHEYAEGHIPGAVLIPLGQLSARTQEINRDKPTVAYCRSGKRSHSAIAILQSAGFTEALSMQGGINAYHGITSTGGPEAGMAWFPHDADAGQLAALAWLLEDGTEQFYRSAKNEISTDPLHRDLFSLLESAELSHKKRLEEVFEKLTGNKAEPDFPAGIIEIPQEPIMEGGVKVSEALQWAAGRDMRDVLELIMALEANALDLYIRMSRHVGDSGSRELFEGLADEEGGHLEKLTHTLTAL